jgi:hypothetical protein
MLAEHGLSGILAFGFLAALPVQAIRRAGASRAVSVTFLVWAVAQMFYANFRVSAVAVAFAFAFLRIDMPSRDPDPPEAVPFAGVARATRPTADLDEAVPQSLRAP